MMHDHPGPAPAAPGKQETAVHLVVRKEHSCGAFPLLVPQEQTLRPLDTGI